MSDRRFDIGLSFPGEHRPYVEEVASKLAAIFSKNRVLYDEWCAAEFARLDLDTYLPNLYRTQSELVVIFLLSAVQAKALVSPRMARDQTIDCDSGFATHHAVALRF